MSREINMGNFPAYSFSEDEIISCESYYELCDYHFPKDCVGDHLKSGIVHVHLDEIKDFFQLIEQPQNKSENYIIVSSRSDYGLFYQDEHPPWADFVKWVQMQIGPHIGYNNINLHARCDANNCNVNDQYSIKMYAWTKCTFPTIPPNIKKWFVVNNSISDSKVVGLPFGVGVKTKAAFANLPPNTKEKRLYLNFANHTWERYELKQWYQSKKMDGVTIVNKEVPFEQYLKNLQSHTFTLCPNGNGIDCYRTLESIYAGSIPIVELNRVTKQFTSLPLVVAPDLHFTGFPEWTKEEIDKYFSPTSLDMARLSYWRGIIKRSRELL